MLEKYPNTYQLCEIKNGKDSKILERLISGDRLHKAHVNGKLRKGWYMPTGKGKTRVYGNQLMPQLPITVPEDTIIVELPDLDERDDVTDEVTDDTVALEPQI